MISRHPFDEQGARETTAFLCGEGWIGARARFDIEPGLPFVAGPQFHGKATMIGGR